jgi:DNA-binding transcriptional ArsR family regulator
MSISPLSRQVQIHKAVAHPARLRVLAMLRSGELCVCQITAVLGLAASTVSAHLGELKAAELVEERKSGRWVHYRLAPGGSTVLDGIWPELAADAAIGEDARLLAALRTVTVEVVCRPDFSLAELVASVLPKECCR